MLYFVYFDSYGVEHVPEKIKKFVGNKNIIANIFRVQANNSVMCGYFCIGFIDFMLAGKKLTDFTNLISYCGFKKNDDIILSYFKDGRNWHNKLVRTEQTKFRLSEIIEIENCFHQEINQRKSCSQKLSKYAIAFDYRDKVLIVLSATSSGVCVISSASVVGAAVGIASASFTLIFFLTTGIIKKLLSLTRSKKKKLDKLLCWLKANLIAIKL